MVSTCQVPLLGGQPASSAALGLAQSTVPLALFKKEAVCGGWYTPVIPAVGEVETAGSRVQGQNLLACQALVSVIVTLE